MNQKIIAYIQNEVSNEPLDEIDLDEDLLGSGIIDSVGMMKLVVYLEGEFEVKINPGDITVENFMTVKNISTFLTQLKSQ